MACGGGFYELALLVTAISLFTLVVVNLFERVYPKDSYRTLELTSRNDTDISQLIDVVERRHIRILFLDLNRNYEENRMVVTFMIRVFNRGVTDKISHAIVHDLESSGLWISQIRWFH
jgi:uncharacterized membrane protein YhiD involved in acid resistance